MLLSEENLNGLSALGNILNLETSKVLISNIINYCLGLGESLSRINSDSDNQDILKQSESAVLTLFALSVKHNYDSEMLKLYLIQNKISNSIILELVTNFNLYRRNLFHFIQQTNESPGLKVTNVEWNLQYNSKSSRGKSSGELAYNINLGNTNISGNRETVTQFQCNAEELQSLINKLKDIERHCEKIIQK